MNRKRERLEIIHSILKTIRNNPQDTKPTHILYKSNLSHQMLTEYLTELAEGKFIEEKTDKKGRKHYVLTEKGFKYLQDYQVIQGFLDSYGLN